MAQRAKLIMLEAKVLREISMSLDIVVRLVVYKGTVIAVNQFTFIPDDLNNISVMFIDKLDTFPISDFKVLVCMVPVEDDYIPVAADEIEHYREFYNAQTRGPYKDKIDCLIEYRKTRLTIFVYRMEPINKITLTLEQLKRFKETWFDTKDTEIQIYSIIHKFRA